MIKNKYKILNKEVIIYLNRKNGEKLETVIDLESFEKIKNLDYNWYASWDRCINGYYVKGTKYIGQYPNGSSKFELVYLHRIITDAPKGSRVDHIISENNGTLNNLLSNLRVTEASKNSQNRKGANKNSGTGHRNVNWGWDRKFYFVQFMRKGERFVWEFPLDKFDEACVFADKKRIELFGEFAGKGK